MPSTLVMKSTKKIMESFAYYSHFANLASPILYHGHYTTHFWWSADIVGRSRQFFTHHPRASLQLAGLACTPSNRQCSIKHNLFDTHIHYRSCHFFTRCFTSCMGYKKTRWYTNGYHWFGHWSSHRIFLWANRTGFWSFCRSISW